MQAKKSLFYLQSFVFMIIFVQNNMSDSKSKVHGCYVTKHYFSSTHGLMETDCLKQRGEIFLVYCLIQLYLSELFNKTLRNSL